MSVVFRAHFALALVALIYGANYSIAKVVLDGGFLTPPAFILLRVVSGLLLFSAFHRYFVGERIERTDWGRLVLCGLFGVAVNQMFFFMGLKLTNPINASLIMTTTPILVLVASSLLIGERITSKKLLGIALGASGAAILILYGNQLVFSRNGVLGDLLIFVNATSYGIYLVLVKSLMKKYHPVTVMRWSFTFGLLFVFPFGIGGLTEATWHIFPPAVWLSFAYVLLCTTFLAYLFNAYALSIVNPSVVSIYIYLQPVIATLVALFLGQAELSTARIGAAVLIFVGVYLVSSPAGRPAAKRS